MPVLHGTASWPDVDSIESCTYTCSHGISPGVAILKMLPQPVFPLMFGDLTITDGEGTVVIPACRIDALKVNQDGSGTVWSLEIVDRRWRWRSLGYLNGSYNQLDIHAKLYPWTIRSPTELAILCLEEMGETGYDLSLPSGLAYPGPNFGLPIINTSGTNPPVNWEATPPAQALQALAEQYGCRVVYRLDTDTVYVGPIGIGGTLPPGSIHKQGPSIKSRETPDSVGVQGAPTRYQVRLELEAVGEEWDGSYRPIDLLSYAPLPPNAAGLTQKSAIVVANPSLGVINYITIDGIEITITDTDSSVATTHGLIAVAINVTQAAGFRKVRATSVLSLPPGILFPVVLVESVAVGVSFDLETAVSRSELYPVPAIYDTLVQASLPASNGTWVYCGPPEFPGDLSGEPGALPGSWSGVRATDRLTVHEARALARKSVFRVYRLTGRDVSGNGPIFVPGYGLLDRRQQIVLQDTQVDQVAPLPKDRGVIDANGLPFTVNFYNGYSRNKPSVCYGVTFLERNASVWYPAIAKLGMRNSAIGSQIFVKFATDPILQQITFDDYIYYQDGDKFGKPYIVLQCAVNVRDFETNQLEAYVEIVPVPGQQTGTDPQMALKSDVVLEITSTYDRFNRLLAFTVLDADPINRAKYYLNGLLQQYLPSTAQTLEYNGIVPIALDGAISQVTWSVGSSGASTTASINTEHDVYVPPYQARRRREFLPPIRNDRVNLWEAGKNL